MAYIDYTYYSKQYNGELIQAEEFPRYLKRAEEVIDNLTGNRACDYFWTNKCVKKLRPIRNEDRINGLYMLFAQAEEAMKRIKSLPEEGIWFTAGNENIVMAPLTSLGGGDGYMLLNNESCVVYFCTKDFYCEIGDDGPNDDRFVVNAGKGWQNVDFETNALLGYPGSHDTVSGISYEEWGGRENFNQMFGKEVFETNSNIAPKTVDGFISSRIQEAVAAQIEYYLTHDISVATDGEMIDSFTVGKVSVANNKNYNKSQLVSKKALDALEQTGLLYRGMVIL